MRLDRHAERSEAFGAPEAEASRDEGLRLVVSRGQTLRFAQGDELGDGAAAVTYGIGTAINAGTGI